MVSLGFADGRRVRKTFTGKTRREVADKINKALRQHADGLPVVRDRQTLEQFLTRWLQDVARHQLKPRTFIRYAELVRIHVLPSLGRRQLNKVTPQDLQQLYSNRLDAGLSPRTVEFIHAVVHRALKYALRTGHVAWNPADVVQAPRPERKDIEPLSAAQVVTLLEHAEGDKLEALYVLAVTTGMRQGELLGLQWRAVDFAEGRIQVDRTLQRIRQEWQLSEPKTEASRRSIRLSELGSAALRRHRAAQLEARLQLGEAWAGESWDLVFCNAYGLPLYGSYVTRSCFRPLLERAGLPSIRFHDLRHTAATRLLARGVHVKKVQDLLGHSTSSITLDIYSHVTPDMQDEVAATMDDLFNHPRTSQGG